MALPESQPDQNFRSAEKIPLIETGPQVFRLPDREEQQILYELASVYPEGFMGYTGLGKFGIEGLTVFGISGLKQKVLLAIRRNNPPAVSVDEGSWSERSVKLIIAPAGKPLYNIIIMFPNRSDTIDSLNGIVKTYCLEVTYAGKDGVTPKSIFTADKEGKRITGKIQDGLIDHVMILAGMKGNTVEGNFESGGYVVLQP